jgi:hypothetical protein
MQGSIDPSMIGEALALFEFDMLAQNADRVEANPNCTIDANGLLVFDFEQCFVLDGRLLKNGDSWSPCARGLAPYHMMHSVLVGKVSKEQIGLTLDRIDVSALDNLKSKLPEEWQDEAERIMGHIASVKAHSSEFKEDIWKALS